jgi:chemotaxis protein histidine kinase CheA
VPLTLESSDSLSKISLEGEIDIGCAAELQGLLVHALGSSKEVQVSLGSATDLDVTAVQLIWAARRAASASAVEFAVTGPVSEPLASGSRRTYDKPDNASSIRVPAAKLDQFVDLVGELVTVQARLSEIAARRDDPESPRSRKRSSG